MEQPLHDALEHHRIEADALTALAWDLGAHATCLAREHGEEVAPLVEAAQIVQRLARAEVKRCEAIKAEISE